MINIESAAFGLKDFHVTECLLKISRDIDEGRINVSFSPEGIYHNESGIFELTIDFLAHHGPADNPETPEHEFQVKAKTKAYFGFRNVDSFEKIPDFFYTNCLAIVYPYIRAFVSSVTLQANVSMLVLPTLNLSAQSDTLRKNSRAV